MLFLASASRTHHAAMHPDPSTLIYLSLLWPSQPIQSPHLDLDASLTVCGVGRYQLTIVLPGWRETG